MKHRHLGVYAIIKQNGRLLLIKKARGPYIGMLDLPGGSIEHGETPEETVKREVLEETGLTVKNINIAFAHSVQFTHNVTDDGSKQDFHHIGIIYEMEIKSGKLKIDSDGLDSNGALWFNYLDGINNLTPFAKKVVDYINNKK